MPDQVSQQPPEVKKKMEEFEIPLIRTPLQMLNLQQDDFVLLSLFVQKTKNKNKMALNQGCSLLKLLVSSRSLKKYLFMVCWPLQEFVSLMVNSLERNICLDVGPSCVIVALGI